jgi:hypothetical protein
VDLPHKIYHKFSPKILGSPLIFEHLFNIFYFFFFFNGSLEEKTGMVKIDAPSTKINGFSLLEKFQ